MVPHVLGLLPSRDGAYVLPHWLRLEVTPVGGAAASTTAYGEREATVLLKCGQGRLCTPLWLSQDACTSSSAESGVMGVTCWCSRRYLSQTHSQQHWATPTSSPGSLWGTAALDKVQLQRHERPYVRTACLSPSQVLAHKVVRKSS